ncbi:MAG: VIT1/CCC1 transporter family protein [Saprospiraceae bacterium]|nr:VIT1/CCC1 transporter family protein [Saprospiraceae bacterium]
MKNKSLENLQTEIDTAWLYDKVAEHEDNPDIANIFRGLAEIERSHAQHFLKQNPGVAMPNPSWRARTLNWVGKVFGYDYLLGVLVETEKSIASAVVAAKNQRQAPVSGTETNHVKILQSLLQTKGRVSGEKLSKLEGKHKTVGGNALRAAVLGGNDGLVSNMSLVMGVAGATGGSGVLLAGVAGLLAGALSMALGEWISVKSSQELYERQMALEQEEIEMSPEAEKKELALIYRAKGISEAEAWRLAETTIADKAHAHEVLVKEELGINAEELQGSAWEAALSSFLLFAVGAILPVLPFFFESGTIAIAWSLILSALGLFLIGAAITLFTGKSVWYSGFRQVLFGLAAAAVTFFIGKLIGVSIAG